MKNSFLITIAISAVLTASCSKEASQNKQTTTNRQAPIYDATSVQRTSIVNQAEDSQTQNSVYRNSRKRLPSK